MFPLQNAIVNYLTGSQNMETKNGVRETDFHYFGNNNQS